MTREQFMQFVNSNETTAENGYYCKVIQNGITYILFGNVSEANLLSDYRNKMNVAGFLYDGRFYGVDYDYREYDLDFSTSVADFEKKFNEAYRAAEKCFTLENPAPITEVTQKAMEKECRIHREENFKYYKEHQAAEDAKREIFGIAYKSYDEGKTHMEKFTPIFFDCLKNPEKFNSYVQNAIEENADIINYRLKCEAEKIKKIEELKHDPALMRTVAIYKALEVIEAKTVKMTCNLYGKTFELSIDHDTLMSRLAFDTDISLYNFTKSVRADIEDAAEEVGIKRYDAKVNFTDIVKITYGKKVIYSE